jgi:HlyD family secretion protein
MQQLKRVLRWWPALLVLVLVAGGVIFVPKLRSTRASETSDLTQVFTAQRGNLVAAITPTGEVYAPRQVELSFDVYKVELIELNVTPGQKVKAGDVLARIDPTTFERAVTQAAADLTVAQDNLEKAKNPYTELDLTQAKVAVAQAEVALKEAQENLEKVRNPVTELELAEARLAVDQAKMKLEEAKENLASVKAGPTKAELASAEAALAAAEENYKAVLAKPDPETVEQAKFKLDQAKNSLWSAQLSRDATCGASARGDTPKSSCDSANIQVLNAEISVRLAEISYQEAQAPATAAEIANAAAQVEQAKEKLEKLRHSPTPLELAEAEAQVAQAEYNLAKAQETLAELEAGPDPLKVAQAEAQVAQAEYNLAKAKDTLAKIEAGPDPKEIEVAQAKVVSAQAALEEAQAALKATTMVAPFDGTVISVGAEKGDLVSSGTTIVTLADLSNLRVRAFVDETEISKVEIGQEVEITFDAFPGQTFWGEVLEVPLQGKLVQNVLTYEVPISLEGAEGVALKPGMTANLRIVVGRRENALLVPALAVQQGEEGYVVMVQDTPQGPAVATPVKVGLSDGTYVEILSGLIEGDRVLVQYQATQQQFPGFGGGIIPGAGREMRVIRP